MHRGRSIAPPAPDVKDVVLYVCSLESHICSSCVSVQSWVCDVIIMQRGKLIVLLALDVAVGWHDIIWAVDMISSEQGLSRVWSHTFAHPAACVSCHYAERMFIVLPAVVWYDIIRARSVTWSESHMCSFLTACVMSLCTEERKVDCTPALAVTVGWYMFDPDRVCHVGGVIHVVVLHSNYYLQT